jgi:hypothetical protein
MITLQQWMELVGYRITEGDSWNGYGGSAHHLSSWNGIHGKGGWSANVVFDTTSKDVFQVEVCDYTNDRAYRIINPDFKSYYNDEDPAFRDQAWDDVNFSDLEVDEDWLDKATAIVSGTEYDERVSIPVDFTDEELLKYMKLAHDRDITFNQLVEEALREAIEEHKRNPEAFKTRADRWKEENDIA